MDNIVFKDIDKKIVKIIDFGLGNSCDHNDLLKSQCGSPDYAAPELFVVNKEYDSKVDLWSFGIVLYAMCSGRMPFRIYCEKKMEVAERRKLLFAEIRKGLGEEQELCIAHLSDNYKDLVRGLITVEVRNRICIEEVLLHPLFYKVPLIVSTAKRKEEQECGFIMNVLESITKLAVNEVEKQRVDKKHGTVDGMYNIMYHDIQENGFKSTFKKKFSKLDNLNNNNNYICRNKKIEINSLEQFTLKNRALDVIDFEDSRFSIAEYDGETKKILHPFQSRPKIPIFKSRIFNEDRLKSLNQKFNTFKLTETDLRPTTTPCPEIISSSIPLTNLNNFRVRSELSETTFQKKTAEPLKPPTTAYQSRVEEPSIAVKQNGDWQVVPVRSRSKKRMENIVGNMTNAPKQQNKFVVPKVTDQTRNFRNSRKP